jgi:hypothetical protein
VLSIRNVRRGIAEEPFDAPAYEVLANAIHREHKLQEDALLRRRDPSFRQQMRQLQLIAAWKTYLKLKPDDPRAHQTVAELYIQQLQYLDVALEHLGLAIKSWDRQPRPATPRERENLAAERKRLEGLYQGLEKEVKRRQEAFDLQAGGLSPFQKVALALGVRPGQGLGLARRALHALQQTRPSQLSESEQRALVVEQVSLLLLLGEVRVVNDNLSVLKTLGAAYYQFEVFCAAAAGEYARADAAIAQYLNLASVENRLPLVIRDQFMRIAPAQHFAGVLTQAIYLDHQLEIAVLLRQAAEWHLVRGILALEQGNTDLARQSFQKAVDFVGGRIYFSELPIAETYLKLIKNSR